MVSLVPGCNIAIPSSNSPITFTFPNGVNTTVTLPISGVWSWAQTSNTISMTHTTTGTTVTVDTPDIELAPELETEPIPVLANRYAGLHLDHGEVKFIPANSHFGGFGIDEDAVCRAGHSHKAPHWGCSCGFYAVPADKLPKHQGDYPLSKMILLVELSGEIIIHEEGYRAEHQRVMEAYVPPCPTCFAPSTTLWFGTESDRLKYIDCGGHVYRQGMVALNSKLEELKAGTWTPDQPVDTEVLVGVTLEAMTRMVGIPFVQWHSNETN
jgi:hypothetical protein